MTARTKTASKRKPMQRKAKKSTAKQKAAPKRATANETKARPKTGTTIERTFKGKTIKVTVTEDGFRVGRTTYRSLTAAARVVTGYPSISGPRFFGTARGN